jgi:hypothetical protein
MSNLNSIFVKALCHGYFTEGKYYQLRSLETDWCCVLDDYSRWHYASRSSFQADQIYGVAHIKWGIGPLSLVPGGLYKVHYIDPNSITLETSPGTSICLPYRREDFTFPDHQPPENSEGLNHIAHMIASTQLPSVRSTDPATAKAADRKAKPKRYAIKARILELLASQREGLTGTELADYTGHRLNSITPRFADLYRDNLIRCSGQQRSGQTVWVLVGDSHGA